MLGEGAKPLVAIACGGTGGHLFPGLAVADQLSMRNCDVLALISPKEVDRKATDQKANVTFQVLPAIGLSGHNYFGFVRGFVRSFRLARSIFARRAPHAVLAMGGFTSAPPIHAGRRAGAATFLHESNTIPGRANRWLARFVHQAFVGFSSTAGRLRHARVQHTGTPVRPQFRPVDPAAARTAMSLRPDRPVLLVMGGSQGASGINELVIQSLPRLKEPLGEWQFLHLTGDRDLDSVRAAYAEAQLPAVTRAFCPEMELALGAATVAVSRAGASSLAELAAMKVPATLVPYPTAADNHQWFNARAFADAGAALLLEQRDATPDSFWACLSGLAGDEGARSRMADAVSRWHKPEAAGQIAESMLALVRNVHGLRRSPAAKPSGPFSRTESVLA